MDERARSTINGGGEGRIIKRPRLIHAYAFYKSAFYGLALFDDSPRLNIEIKKPGSIARN